MKETMFKGFAVLFGILLVFSNIAFLQPQVSDAAALDKAVTITAFDENGEEVLPLSAVSFEEGDTAFDVLVEAGEKQDVDIEFSEHSEYGKNITGIGGKANADPYYWSFHVNGIGASVGVSSYKVENGDHLFFTLTDNFDPSVTAKVSALKGDGSTVIPETEVKLMKGATAYGALIQAATKNNTTVTATVDDQYFTFINNIGETDLGETGYWSIAVDGQSLQSGILQQHIESGEHLQLTVNTPPAEDNDKPEQEKPEEETVDSDLVQISDKLIQSTINELITYIEENNISITYGSDWWVWGLESSGQEIPNTFVTSVKEELSELEDGKFRSIYDLEKTIISLSAAGVDATSIEGHDLIQQLVNRQELKDPLVNAAIYGLLAIDSGQYKVEEEFKNHLIDTILNQEVGDGGWAFSGNTPSPDLTGMVLAALAPHRDYPGVQAAIDRAVSYLSTEQVDSGGYTVDLNGGDSSEALSQVIIGLASVGENPTGSKFTKSGGNLLQHLIKFKDEDGGFKHVMDDESGNAMSTQQALLAFNAYQNLIKGTGSVYQFAIDANASSEESTESTATNTGYILLIGFALLLVGTIVYFVYRKRAA